MRQNVDETWSKVNGNESFSDAAFIAVTALSITLFSAETWNAVGASFLHSSVYALGTCCARAAAEDLYQSTQRRRTILRERCDKVTLRNWLSRGERMAGPEGKLSPGEPRFPFSPFRRLILPSFRLLNPTRSYFVPELLLLDDFFFLLHFKPARCYFARRRSEKRKESKVYAKSSERKNLIQLLSCHEKSTARYALFYRDYCVTLESF